MSQSLAKDFNFHSLLKFAFPSIIMMIFMSLYSIVDGFFIAQYVDSMALSAANIVYPAVSILLAVGIMFGTGGSAVVAAKIGQEKQEEANRNFSALTLTTLIIGILGAVLGNLFCRQICSLLGATPVLMDYGTAYLRTILSFAPVCLLQALFQSFFVTAGRPGLGLSLTVSAGITNMLLDYLFVVPLHLGVAGAALATGLGQCIPAVAGILYFTFARKGLRFTRPEFSKGLLSTSCFNGSSEMVSNLSAAVVTYLFNMLMLKFEGEIGVAAITAILYGQFLFVALYLGYSIGVAPVFSFNYGSRNKQRLIRLYRISIRFVVVSSVIIALVAAFGSPVISAVFMQKGTYGFELTRHGGYLFSIAYLFCGTNIVASGIFTALSDGKTSALISFLRTFVFIVLSALLLPLVLGTNGVWLSIPVAEFLTLFISVPKLSRYFTGSAVRGFSFATTFSPGSPAVQSLPASPRSNRTCGTCRTAAFHTPYRWKAAARIPPPAFYRPPEFLQYNHTYSEKSLPRPSHEAGIFYRSWYFRPSNSSGTESFFIPDIFWFLWFSYFTAI